MTIFTCAPDLEAILSCVYEAWASRLGYRNLRLFVEPVTQPELFVEYRHVDGGPDRAEKVMRAVQRRISFSAWQTVCRCALSRKQERADIIYRFLLYGFAYGRGVLDMLQEPAVLTAFELSRQVEREAHAFIEFLRFANVGDAALVAHIEPKSDVLTLIAPHFADRLPSENWIILDDNRKAAIVHPANREYYMTAVSDEELELLRNCEAVPDPFVSLWTAFFDAIEINERKNPRCQHTLLPLWYRKHMTEFRR